MVIHPISNLLSHPTLYHYIRQVATGGMPFRRFIRIAGLDQPGTRVADIGCGPADLLRYFAGQATPGYYLGIDVSDRYLSAATRRAASKRVPAQFVSMDLERLSTDEQVQDRVLDALREHEINTVLLMGVLHHISDNAARDTLNLVHRLPSVRRLVTQDVVRIPSARVNNLFCDMDRGEFIRTEPEYQRLIRSTDWELARQEWTQTGVRFVKYINFVLTR